MWSSDLVFIRTGRCTRCAQEFLFAAYSTFTVTKVVWSESPDDEHPHEVFLEAAIDNMKEPEDLPLAPWY